MDCSGKSNRIIPHLRLEVVTSSKAPCASPLHLSVLTWPTKKTSPGDPGGSGYAGAKSTGKIDETKFISLADNR